MCAVEGGDKIEKTRFAMAVQSGRYSWVPLISLTRATAPIEKKQRGDAVAEAVKPRATRHLRRHLMSAAIIPRLHSGIPFLNLAYTTLWIDKLLRSFAGVYSVPCQREWPNS